jgi:hypothetical protein
VLAWQNQFAFRVELDPDIGSPRARLISRKSPNATAELDSINMGKLTPNDINEYFENHLPYRTRIMLAHYKMTHDDTGANTAWTSNPAWLDGCFVASLVTGRIYLNLLGIGKKHGALCPFSPQRDDVTVADLSGVLLDPAKLPTNERTLFLNFLIMADKAAAHFTTPRNHDWNMTHEVIELINSC